MGAIDDYLATLGATDRAVLERAYSVAREELGDTEQGVSYRMPALFWRGRPVLALMRTARHVGVYPFSGLVVAAVADRLDGLGSSSGAIRVPLGMPVPDDLVRAIVRARRAEIEDPRLRRRR